MTDDDGHGAFSPDGVNTQTDNALETTGAIPSYTIRNLRFNHAPTKGRWGAYDPFRHWSTLARQVKGERLAET
jgi:hypothetical protein